VVWRIRKWFGIDGMSGLFVGTLGTLVLGLAPLVILTLTFGECVSLLCDNSLPFCLTLLIPASSRGSPPLALGLWLCRWLYRFGIQPRRTVDDERLADQALNGLQVPALFRLA
jgi:hypothetical protein